MRALLLSLILAGCAQGGPDHPPADDLAAADLGGRSDGGESGRLRVLSLNLHCLKVEGTVFADNRARFAAVARLMAERRVDVLLAQELCERPGESGRALLGEALARMTGAAWHSEAAFTHLSFAGTPDEADEHVALFARGPLLRVSRTRYRAQSGLVRVVIGADYGGLRLYSTHLDYQDPAVRVVQARETAALALWEADPWPAVLIGGDFNAGPGTAVTQALIDSGFADATAALPAWRIDHAYLHRGAPFLAEAAELLFTGAEAVSDHPGVLVVLRERPASPVALTRIAARGISGTAALWVRGGTRPLTWSWGWPAFASPDGRHRFVTSELPPGRFEYKFLRDDRDWQTGANAAGQGQADNEVAPAFP